MYGQKLLLCLYGCYIFDRVRGLYIMVWARWFTIALVYKNWLCNMLVCAYGTQPQGHTILLCLVETLIYCSWNIIWRFLFLTFYFYISLSLSTSGDRVEGRRVVILQHLVGCLGVQGFRFFPSINYLCGLSSLYFVWHVFSISLVTLFPPFWISDVRLVVAYLWASAGICCTCCCCLNWFSFFKTLIFKFDIFWRMKEPFRKALYNHLNYCQMNKVCFLQSPSFVSMVNTTLELKYIYLWQI